MPHDHFTHHWSVGSYKYIGNNLKVCKWQWSSVTVWNESRIKSKNSWKMESKAALVPLIALGAAAWYLSVLFRPVGWCGLRCAAGRRLSPAHASAGPGPGCILSPGSPPPTGHVLHSLQQGRVQEPTPCSQQGGRSGRLLWNARSFGDGGEGQRLGVMRGDLWDRGLIFLGGRGVFFVFFFNVGYPCLMKWVIVFFNRL